MTDTNSQESVRQPSTSMDDPLNLQFDDGLPLETPEAPPEEEAAQTEVEEVTEEDTADETNQEPEVEAEAEEAEVEAEEPESEAKAADEEEQTEETEQASATEPEVLVTLDTGEQLTMDAIVELKKSGMMQADYTRKTQELAETRRQLEANAERINSTIDAFSSYLASLLPPEPDPALAYGDDAARTAYTQQKASYDAALKQVQQVISMGQQSKATTAEMTSEQRKEQLRSENAALEEKLPHLKDPKKREEFNAVVFRTAKDFGFTEKELDESVDHRLYHLGYWAHKGILAEQAKTKALKKTVNVPPASPGKKRVKKANTAGQRNKKLMDRLKQTGSIQDAKKIDFV